MAILDCIFYLDLRVTHPSDAKLIWNCRRGMLELDLILSRFIEQHLGMLTPEQKQVFARLLDFPDPDIYAYLMGQLTSSDPEIRHFVAHLRANNTF
jgi:antitoxin CptB